MISVPMEEFEQNAYKGTQASSKNKKFLTAQGQKSSQQIQEMLRPQS
jgi:hypothetical protein